MTKQEIISFLKQAEQQAITIHKTKRKHNIDFISTNEYNIYIEYFNQHEIKIVYIINYKGKIQYIYDINKNLT